MDIAAIVQSQEGFMVVKNDLQEIMGNAFHASLLTLSAPDVTMISAWSASPPLK